MILRIGRGRSGKRADDTSFWISYSDLMTAMMIVFMLMVAISLLDIHEKQEQQEMVRKEIVAELVSRLQQKYPVAVDAQTGAITISDGILFGFNEITLTESGKQFLREFIPEYTEILLGNDRIREQISQIIIEGHADNVGSYEANLDKSLGRAYTVSTFVFSPMVANFANREELKYILTANGRANMEPKETAEKSRRVEIKFRLKDWNLIKGDLSGKISGGLWQ